MSMIYAVFNSLLKNSVYHDHGEVDPGIRKAIVDVIAARWKKYRKPCMDVAFLLDPTQGLHGFVEDEARGAVECVSTIAQTWCYTGARLKALTTELHHYTQAKARWSPVDLIANRKLPLQLWWETSRYKTLSGFAARILSVPSSSAPSERSWSINGFIHSKKRNRLDPARVEKLAFIYTNLGDKGPVTARFYRERQPPTSDGWTGSELDESCESSESSDEFATTARNLIDQFSTAENEEESDAEEPETEADDASDNEERGDSRYAGRSHGDESTHNDEVDGLRAPYCAPGSMTRDELIPPPFAHCTSPFGSGRAAVESTSLVGYILRQDPPSLTSANAVVLSGQASQQHADGVSTW